MAVDLTGNLDKRYVVVQPANVTVNGIPGNGGDTSQFVYSKQIWLVQ
jgi:hypothetical protein